MMMMCEGGRIADANGGQTAGLPFLRGCDLHTSHWNDTILALLGRGFNLLNVRAGVCDDRRRS